MVNVELCQFLLMNADLVLLLDLNDPGLNFLPRCIGKLRLKHTQKKGTIKVTGWGLMSAAAINIDVCIWCQHFECLRNWKARQTVVAKCLPHHGHLECVDVERPDLPVTANVIEEFDQAMQPKHSRDDQNKYHKGIVSDTEKEKRSSFIVRRRNLSTYLHKHFSFC